MKYAGFWIRALACLIDLVILSLPVAIVTLIFPPPPSHLMTFLRFFYSILCILYFVILESSRWQGTFGKKTLGIIVTDLNGNRISVRNAFGRYIAQFFSTILFCFGYIMIAFSDKKQGLHDKIAKTLVIYKF